MTRTEKLGTAPISSLLKEQAIPASIGILVMSIYGIIDTIFVGQYVGSIAIAAITVIMPITFLIGSIGMSIGIGGSSIISRALGESDTSKAFKVFGNQVSLIFIFCTLAMIGGWWYQDAILQLFGGKGDILPVAREYFTIILPAVPFLAWAMMCNTVIRAEGQPKIAMITMLVPALVNLILDPILIVYFKMGIAGAAWATTFGYISSGLFTIWYFVFGKSTLKIKTQNLSLNGSIVKEIFSLGGVTLARQGIISVLAIVLNNTLFSYGGALAISIYGIIQRIMMFANFPVIGITQGFLPIAGYNYGAKNWDRVKETIKLSIKSGTIIAVGLFACILLFAPQIARIFTNEQDLIQQAAPALRISFLATPLILLQLIGSAYFQAIGKAIPALFLTLTKQGFCLIPLLIFLPPIFGLNGIWISFPIADVLAASICFIYLRKGIREMEAQGEEKAMKKVEEVVIDGRNFKNGCHLSQKPR